MKKLFLLIFIAFIIKSAFAQQLTIVSNYQSNPYILNKAFTGYNNASEICLTAKKYFIGFAYKNPGFQSLNFSTRKDYYGMGISLYNDNFGNTKFFNLGLTYAYHLDMGDKSLSFALSPKLIQFGLNQSNYIYFDDNDDAITNSAEHKIVFDADFGILFYTENIQAGLSINNLMQPNISVGGNESSENKITRNFNLISTYSHEINENFRIQPSILLTYNSLNLYYDLNFRAKIKNLVWVGTGYKQVKALSIMFGVDYKNYSFAYSYDHNLSYLSGFTHGSHEIFIGIKFNKLQSKSKI